MEVIIDTNILFGDWMLRTDDAKAFLAYIERTSSSIYVPKIVWEETQKNYHDDLAAKHSAYEKASRALGRVMINQPDFKRVRLHEDDAESYLDWLRKKLRFDVLENVLPYGNFTERIAKRAMAKRKPFNYQNNNEYKDCIVWETVIDVLTGALGRSDTEVVLISNDANAFGAGKVAAGKHQERGQRQEKQVGVLHPQLQEETDELSGEKGKKFYYYESFAEFLAAHYTPIKGIDEESVREYLNQEASGFAQLIQKELGIRTAGIVTSLQSTFRPASISLSEFTINKLSLIQDFYVYSF
jgi:predicted nucleic acid-binding protein